jgi:hypothetical protein
MSSMMVSTNFGRMTYQDFAGEDGSTYSEEAINMMGAQEFGQESINTGLDLGSFNFG